MLGYYGNVIKALKVKKGLKYLAKIPSDKGSEGKKKKTTSFTTEETCSVYQVPGKQMP